VRFESDEETVGVVFARGRHFQKQFSTFDCSNQYLCCCFKEL